MFRFSACSSVSNSNCLNIIRFYHFLNFSLSLRILIDRRMGINCFIVQQISLFIQTNYFASGSKARIDTHHPFLSQWRGKKQLFQIFGKNTDGFVVGFFFTRGCKFIFNCRLQKSFERIFDSINHLRTAFVIRFYKYFFQTSKTFFLVCGNTHFQKTFIFASANCQQAM